ncbi:SWI/SNF chromatin-remodeling complex subunit sol1 [Golovinomyces cichoracearum]|uniref:SWI/SNF chromatin-remodeling complex subunit sol1 n=1 Tax=Golovinomyces cichoracearum TaxID=62708 RepID=A0A420ICU7_9PEZI|nr:SWI/SNF chromatin-remodeling complex subunit sol1 [Golovinomyces cichoracearum]
MNSTWVNKTAIQNHNGGAYVPNELDTNCFRNPASFETSSESSQYQNQQLQRMQNGSMRNGSSASFNNPQYQTNSVVPSKRSREESMRASPQQTPGLLPQSRSQTPKQNPYSSYQLSQQSSQHQTQQTSYSRLHDSSGNATPSPVISNQIRPNNVPQRVSTASPLPFSPAVQQFHQLSPSLSEQGSSRFDVSQPLNQYTPGSGYPQGYGQSFSPSLSHSAATPQHTKTTPNTQKSNTTPQPQLSQMFHQQQHQQNLAEQQRLLYQMQLHQQQQQLQHRNIMTQRSNPPANTNSMPSQQTQTKNAQFPGLRPSIAPPPNRAIPNPEGFIKSLVSFMQGKKLPLEMNPFIGNRAISLVSLYFTVAKLGGYKRVMATNGWESVAAALQFHPMEFQVAQQIKGVYERNLMLYEEAISINQQRQRTQLMQQNPITPGLQMSPAKQQNSQAISIPQQIASYMPPQQQSMVQHAQNQVPAITTPIKKTQSISHQQLSSANGFPSTQPSQVQQNPSGSQVHPRDNLSRGIETTPPQTNSFPIPSPASATRSTGIALQSPKIDPHTIGTTQPQNINLPSIYEPKVVIPETFGGIEIPSLMRLGGELNRFKPDVPPVGDLGTIDVNALTLSLKSGIHAEVRLALDTLVSLSMEPRLQLDLRACEDLVETMIDCAETQVELLAENSAEVSDVMLISYYEDVFRGCRSEQEILRDIAVFGSLEYELDRAVDRLICITTTLRNLSFYETNHPLLAEDFVIKFFCIVIRHLGTRNMLLRTNSNTLDFMKDLIIFLSNLAQQIELPGKEQALCLLHFVLAFAPCPSPNSANSTSVTFSTYDPNFHRYLPPAVDSLAKLLARDEPNRSLYKSIFASDVASIPPFDLLTRAFALAISSVPEDGKEAHGSNLTLVVEARKPFLMQGILAAGILSNLAPGHETGVTKSWLMSNDGFSQNLCRLIISLCLEANSMNSQRQLMAPQGVDHEPLFHIMLGGITVLRRLVEKSRDPEDPNSILLSPGVVAKGSLLAAMNIVQPKLQGILKQLYAYVGLGT